MFVIKCPHCGDRDMVEFSYGGDATVEYPKNPDTADAAEWHAFVYERANPRGWHLEWWQHATGCRSWVKVLRNTLTHEIAATGLPGDQIALPEGDA